MKNLFVLILSFSFSFSFAQSISWAPNSEVEESLYSSFYGISGDYIGEINNSHFYIYCHLKSLLIPSDDIVFSILKVQNNQVVQSTEFFKKKYNVLKFMIFEDEIAVIYVNDSLDNIHHICIDTYNREYSETCVSILVQSKFKAVRAFEFGFDKDTELS